MKTIIIDDEAPVRAMLRDLLSRRPQIEILAEAKNGIEAIEKINELRPDLIFLDIQMPVLSGFDILPYLKEKPLIVFVTAYDQYALQAFEACAVDYLLKPVDEDRLLKCLEKLENQWEKIQKVKGFAKPKEGLEKLLCSVGGSVKIAWIRDVFLFRKEGRYTGVVMRDGAVYLTDLTLDYLEEQVDPRSFFRISRAVIVAKNEVAGFKVQHSGTGLVGLKNDETYTVSRSRVPAFRAWLAS